MPDSNSVAAPSPSQNSPEFGLPVIILGTSRFFPEADDMAHEIEQSDANTKANEFLFRRLTVEDAAEAHVVALEKLAGKPGVHTYNLGTGQGNTVLEVVKTFEEASGKPVPYEIVDRRPGDVAESWADVTKAAEELGWQAGRDLATMCADAWRWQQQAR